MSEKAKKSGETTVDTPPTAQEILTAELAGQVFAGRPERLVDVALGMVPLPPEHARAAMTSVTETLAALALADTPEAPSPAVKARIVKTLAARAKGGKRALLVVDMLNDHLTPGLPLEVPRAREIVGALAKRIDRARSAKMPIVYVCDAHEPGDTDLEAWAVHNLAGSHGAEVWPELAPKPGDLVVHKPTYSAFQRSNLQAVLEDLKVDTLVMTGCSTELGLLATATDALQRGYAIEMPPDTQAGMSEASEKMALGLLHVMPPYGPARQELLARVRAA
ncbi:MAG TPA: isochorismatase family cysteine hydrolase [Polyangiaceae bacterium]